MLRGDCDNGVQDVHAGFVEDVGKDVLEMLLHGTYIEIHVSTRNTIQGQIKIPFSLLPFFPGTPEGTPGISHGSCILSDFYGTSCYRCKISGFFPPGILYGANLFSRQN